MPSAEYEAIPSSPHHMLIRFFMGNPVSFPNATVNKIDKLADELLKEILAPQLLVSEELFADTGTTSPFSKAERSSSDVLLVCKRWMRVATPPLYHTVVIRSMAQAKALTRALKSSRRVGAGVSSLPKKRQALCFMAVAPVLFLTVTPGRRRYH